jgi:cellobiose phosphorylase
VRVVILITLLLFIKKHSRCTLQSTVFDGYESIGGLHFAPVRLEPGESTSYTLILGLMTGDGDVEALIDRYGSEKKFSLHLQENQAYWQEKLATLRFTHHDDRLDGWLQWVTLQPILRRIMGNSFLPYHDYGRGGRGWRDLWQDLLTLLLTEGKG